jgi:hypothetical protein
MYQETISFYWAHLSRFNLKMETEYRPLNVVFQMKYRMMDKFQNCGVILIYHRHKLIDNINLFGS